MAQIIASVCKVLPEECGHSAKGEWVRRSVIVDYGEEFPRMLCITAIGQDRADALEGLQIGQTYTFNVHLASREFNGKWYTECLFLRLGT